MVDREILRRIVLRWASGELSTADVADEAELLLAEVGPYDPPQRDSPDSIALEVLEMLDTALSQPMTVDDVPAILIFLGTPAGDELRAHDEWVRYWESVNWSARNASMR